MLEQLLYLAEIPLQGSVSTRGERSPAAVTAQQARSAPGSLQWEPSPSLPCPSQHKWQRWREKREFSPKARPDCPERNILSFTSLSVSSNPWQGQKQ